MARVEGAAALAAVDAVARVVVDVVARAAARAVARAAADAAGRAVSRAVVLAAALAVVDVVPAAGLADRAAHVGRVAPVVDLFRFLVVHLCEIFFISRNGVFVYVCKNKVLHQQTLLL